MGRLGGGAPASGTAPLREPEPETPGRRPALRWRCQDAPTHLRAGNSGNYANAVEAGPGRRVGRMVAERLVGGSGCARKIGSGIIRKTSEEIGGKFEPISFPDHAAPGEAPR